MSRRSVETSWAPTASRYDESGCARCSPCCWSWGPWRHCWCRYGPTTPPKLAYVAGNRFIHPGGRTRRLPVRGGISAVTPYQDGFLVADARYFEGSLGLLRIDGDGRRGWLGCSTGSPVVSRDCRTTAWSTFPCPEAGEPGVPTVHLGRTQGGPERSAELPGTRLLHVVGVLGDDLVVGTAFGSGGYLTDLVRPPRPVPQLESLASVDEGGGLVAGRAGRRGVVRDPETGRVQWSRRGVHPSAFSPDGALVAWSRRRWRVPGRGGAERYALRLPREWWVDEPVWEDARQLLAVVSAGGECAVLRVGPGGRPVLATPVAAEGRGGCPYVLAVAP